MPTLSCFAFGKSPSVVTEPSDSPSVHGVRDAIKTATERDAFFAHSGDERYQIGVDSSSSTDDADFLAPNRRVRLARLTAPPFDGPVADGASVRGPGHARDTQTASVLVASAFIVRVVPRIRPRQEFHAV